MLSLFGSSGKKATVRGSLRLLSSLPCLLSKAGVVGAFLSWPSPVVSVLDIEQEVLGRRLENALIRKANERRCESG